MFTFISLNVFVFVCAVFSLVQKVHFTQERCVCVCVRLYNLVCVTSDSGSNIKRIEGCTWDRVSTSPCSCRAVS